MAAPSSYIWTRDDKFIVTVIEEYVLLGRLFSLRCLVWHVISDEEWSYPAPVQALPLLRIGG